MIVVTAAAEADLATLGDYIARQNLVRAIGFIRERRVDCELLAENPLGCPLVPRFEDRGIRQRVHGNYLIFYRISADTIEIIHVLNAAMNHQSLLVPEH